MNDSHSKPLTFDFRDQFPPNFDATPLVGTAKPSDFKRVENAIIGILSKIDVRDSRIPRGVGASYIIASKEVICQLSGIAATGTAAGSWADRFTAAATTIPRKGSIWGSGMMLHRL